jgi:hypothetical protein
MGASAENVPSTLRYSWYLLALLAVAAPPLIAQSPEDPTGGGTGPTLERAGNCNGDGSLDVADPVFMIDFLFHGGTPPTCKARCDFEQDGTLDLSDVIAFFEFMLRGGSPPAPLPEGICSSTVNLRFSWTPVTEDVRGNPETVVAYRVYLRSEKFSGVEASTRAMLKQVPSDCSCATVVDGDLPQIESDTLYIFSVTAVDAAGNESDPSNEVSLTL